MPENSEGFSKSQQAGITGAIAGGGEGRNSDEREREIERTVRPFGGELRCSLLYS